MREFLGLLAVASLLAGCLTSGQASFEDEPRPAAQEATEQQVDVEHIDDVCEEYEEAGLVSSKEACILDPEIRQRAEQELAERERRRQLEAAGPTPTFQRGTSPYAPQAPSVTLGTRGPSELRDIEDWVVLLNDGSGFWYNTRLLRHHPEGVCHERYRDHFPITANGPFGGRGGWVPGHIIAREPADCVGQWVWVPVRAFCLSGMFGGEGREGNPRTLAVRINVKDSYERDNDDWGHWGQHGAIEAPGLYTFGVRADEGFDMLLNPVCQESRWSRWAFWNAGVDWVIRY